MLVPSIFSGVTDSPNEAGQNSFVPSTGFGKAQLLNRNPTLYKATEQEIERPKLLNRTIDYSTRRGVLNCSTNLTHQVLRTPPVKQSIKPPSGMGRGQSRSLSQMDKPPFGKILANADSHDVSVKSKLGHPK